MKYIAIIVIALLIQLHSVGQEIPPAPENKAVVYFVRTSGLGFAINFTYLDSGTLIAKANGTNYVRYECEQGHHLFWVRSENKDFVDAEVEAGKIYFLEAVPQMGAIKAAVQLRPVDPTDKKTMERIFKLMNKKGPEISTAGELQKEFEASKEIIQRGLEKYSEEKGKNKKTERLEKNMYYTPGN